ncbi:hypothetical protein H0H92_004211 [Tricholoma furcatifolium]|nr:hypothetical protein H0H92_004211 [Tricholoma furcatifolium]
MPLSNGQPSHYQEHRDDPPQLPLSDSIKWYYPSQGYESDEEMLEAASIGGNWGNKTIRGARWVRQGKMATWGPSMDDWQAEERARKRLKLLLPQERRSPSPPTLPHLERSPSPPLLPPYPPPDIQHLSYASYVMDKANIHSFRSNLIDELENATNGLIEGEATLNRALGRLWQVINEDCDKTSEEVPLVPKQEDGDEDVNKNDNNDDDEAPRRSSRVPDLTPAINKIFLLPYTSEDSPSHFASMDTQVELLEKSVSTLRELQDDGREYCERLQEIRDTLGDVRAHRDGIWDMIRERAVQELHDNFQSDAWKVLLFDSCMEDLDSQTSPSPTMAIPDITTLSLEASSASQSEPQYDGDMRKLEAYAKSLPYAIEPYHKMLELLDFIILRIVQCVEARDYEVGLFQWDSMLTYTIPGMPISVVAICADAFCNLTQSKKKITIDDMRLPWKPIYEILKSDLFLKRRQFEYTLAEMHVDPSVSDPRKIPELPDDERVEGESRPCWSHDDLKDKGEGKWTGLYKDVGIFTEHEWQFFMCKCLASMEIPLADAGSLTTGPNADNQASFEINRLPKPDWRITRILVYSMAPDGVPVPPSNAPTPIFSPLPSGMSTPQVHDHTAKEFLGAPLGKHQGRAYLAGSKALDSLARLIASTESFFHPSNSGAWTNDHRRLTKAMKRELVKSLRTVTLLAMFSQDSTTVANIQSCIKSMCVMEPDLMLDPILERAVPSLEALVETQRTIAVIKALGAVAPAIVSRDVYYPGAKHLVPILQLLIPGIDLLCTTAFLVEISQFIKFGDLTMDEGPRPLLLDAEPTLPANNVNPALPSFSLDDADARYFDMKPRLTEEVEDALLKDSTGNFPDWVASFIRRVIQLLENLPDESPGGSAGGATEVQLIDAVTGACSQICTHLSGPLYDLVLNIIFDYASTNVRPNAVRAIHQLVECVANADPVKTLAKFFPYCARNIRIELDNGASSLRTTSISSPLPSDATLHWSLTSFRLGYLTGNNLQIPSVTDDLKTYSKRGYSWSGKLLSSTLLTLTHTYPLENRFVNPESWGKLYEPDDVTLSWHSPSEEEIQFAVEIFRVLIEPVISLLEHLIEEDTPRNDIWRNDFCRHLSFVRNAFSGIPTFLQQKISREDAASATATSDILNEIPEMIASVDPIASGFCLTDAEDSRYQYISSLRNRFGIFLHNASKSLQQQGEENTVDAVDMLIRAVRTYLLDYGDSRDSYAVNDEQYRNDKNVARNFANQKIWPRAVYVRRARCYHSARLHWNSIERRRGPVEDALIDDVVEWSIWHYAVIRRSSQSLLAAICDVYDGTRRRALPILFKALEPGTDDDRMKGALWTLNSPCFGKYAITEPSLSPTVITSLLSCQHNEKPSIQDCVSAVAENGLNSFLEPNYLFYDISTPRVDKAVAELRATLDVNEDQKERHLVARARQRRVERCQLLEDAVQASISSILEIGESEDTHWRYEIVATRALRTLVRRDAPTSTRHLQYFLDRIHDDHPTIRYYSQRALTKIARNIKLRTFCTTPTDLALMRIRNPLKMKVVVEPSHQLTNKILAAYRTPFDPKQDIRTPLFFDQDPPGWVAWNDSVSLYLPPSSTLSVFSTWEPASKEAVETLREAATDSEFWEAVAEHYAEENHETSLTQDNASFVKSTFQLLQDQPFEALRPTLEELMKDKDQNKQRAAAEFLAGLIAGEEAYNGPYIYPRMKHWPTTKQENIWTWLKPFMKQIFANVKTDTLMIWTTFVEYIFYHTDPRRVQPMVDFIVTEFKNIDYNAEMTFDGVKGLSLFRAFYEELGRKFDAWTEETLSRVWAEISSEHDDLRAYIGEILAFTQRVKWAPKPSLPTTEVFVKECLVVPQEYDIMNMRGSYHKDRVTELVERFAVWRDERLPGVRAFQSTYDRVGILVCKWLYRVVHDVHAIPVFDYILPLMPELFRFTELHDNTDLSNRANVLLVRMCGVTPPLPMVPLLLDGIFEAIRTSPSWRIRLKALPLVQVPLISEIKIVEILEVLCRCLDDEVVEVREMAATTLSGILRLSPRRSVITLKDRFTRLAKRSHLPPRQDPGYVNAIRQRHAAILGICALVDSYPYTVENWMPALLTNVLAEHTYDPVRMIPY